MSPPTFVPADLLSGIDTRANAAGARLFVTLHALMDPKATSAAWPVLPDHTRAMLRGPVTVLSVLLELKGNGLLDQIERVEGGYAVTRTNHEEKAA